MNVVHRPLPDPRALRRRRDRAAGAGTAFLVSEALKGLEERLAPIEVDASYVLDIGAGPGDASRYAAGRWRGSRVVSADVSRQMLRAARKSRSRFARIREVQADAARLPFADGRFDAAIANLSLPYADGLPAALAETARVLKTGGVVAFATLGPDTLKEVAAAWAAVDEYPHVLPFADMHDIGDLLGATGFAEPVLDVERLSITYRDPVRLFADLTAAGARNTCAGRFPALTGRGRFRRFESALAELAGNDPLTVSVELVFGHAWRAAPRPEPGEVRVDAAGIGRRGRS